MFSVRVCLVGLGMDMKALNVVFMHFTLEEKLHHNIFGKLMCVLTRIYCGVSDSVIVVALKS